MTVCVRPAAGQALAETGAGGAGGASAGALSRSVFRSERAAFPGEVAARAPDRAELQLGEAGVARCRTGEARAQARSASPAASAAASARDVVAHRRHHRWFQDERWYDLIVILDDATSEIYYAQLV